MFQISEVVRISELGKIFNDQLLNVEPAVSFVLPWCGTFHSPSPSPSVYTLYL
jgi:hypothetical protein